jgi:hypothetical protein
MLFENLQRVQKSGYIGDDEQELAIGKQFLKFHETTLSASLTFLLL